MTNKSLDTDYNDDFVYMNLTFCGSNKNTTPGWCPETFDNYSCWPSTPPGHIANITCPRTLFYNSTGLAFKQCLVNGSWYVNEKNIAWSNYTQCVDMEHLEFLMLINRLNVIGYSISLVALVVSLWIFLRFKSLRCIRIKIHIQLFTSFILNNVMWIVWYEKVIPEVDITINNMLWCQIFHVLKEYFMVANYMWMFCEALHLHLALVVVFVREERSMKWFYAIGWGVSFLIVLVHSMVRMQVTQDTAWCWMYESTFATWFLSIPVVVTLTLSMIFLINILRVLLTIMHPNSQNPAPIGIRRAVRAALILTPLFGLQFVFIPVRPYVGHPLYTAYMYTTVIIIPFQGLCCAILFCFANHDVHQAIKRSFQRNVVSRQSMRQSTRWSNFPGDSAGVANGQNGTNMVPLLSIKRKSVPINTTVKL